MPVHPIEWRYGSQEMRSIFDVESSLQRMLDVEAALARALAKVGIVPMKDAKKIASCASIKKVRIERIRKLEQEFQHETMAVAMALAEAAGKSGRYVHLGATSNDILDTAMALQIRDGLDIIERQLRNLLMILLHRALEHRNTIMVGRTHGQHALPTTLGLKLAIWASEIGRHLERLEQLKPRVLVGKMSGAVGTGAAWGEHAEKVQRLVMQELRLTPATATNQILQRDRLAELILFFGLVASTLDKMAREIRNLQRTEIGEVAEPFAVQQVGSSTMPHKRNPIRCEKICGLARILRSHVQAAMENVVLEHERDLTNSSCERVLLPESFLLIDEMLNTAIFVLSKLNVFPEQMKKNLEMTKGLNMAEAVMIELTRRGMNRQEAHAVLRRCSALAIANDQPLIEILARELSITKFIPKEELGELLDYRRYLGRATAIVDKVVKELELHTKAQS
ncbi:adenylosuccinate lyase [Candidatus Bipolaricaulota bacterium]|nr:adenylosuccinate lyase [Candidatus Bipolaricaulota bacterium]